MHDRLVSWRIHALHQCFLVLSCALLFNREQQYIYIYIFFKKKLSPLKVYQFSLNRFEPWHTKRSLGLYANNKDQGHAPSEDIQCGQRVS